MKLNCTLDENCPVFIEKTKSICAGAQADARYYLKAIDRADGVLKVLDVGKQILNAIGGLIENPDWGHCKGFDVTIKKGKKGDMPLYTIEPSPHKALTNEDLEMIKNSEDPDSEDFIDLEARIQPLTAEVAGKILRGPDTNSSKSNFKSKPATKKSEDKEDFSKKDKDEDEHFEVNWDEA